MHGRWLSSLGLRASPCQMNLSLDRIRDYQANKVFIALSPNLCLFLLFLQKIDNNVKNKKIGNFGLPDTFCIASTKNSQIQIRVREKALLTFPKDPLPMALSSSKSSNPISGFGGGPGRSSLFDVRPPIFYFINFMI